MQSGSVEFHSETYFYHLVKRLPSGNCSVLPLTGCGVLKGVNEAAMIEQTELQAELARLQVVNAALQEQLAMALERIAALEGELPPGAGAPGFVKPTRPKTVREQQPCKKRAAEHNTSRRRVTPTRIDPSAG
jgi:hypothetical protein